MAHHDPVIHNAHHNLGTWVAILAVAVASAAAIGLSVKSTKQSEDTAEKVQRAGPPCVDVERGPGVRPSRGCRRFFIAIAELCAQDPGFCRRSQKRAARRATAKATDQQLAQAQLPEAEGGGGSGGGNTNPNSPTSPSPGNGGGGQDGPNAPSTPQNPPPTEQPPVTPQPETPDKPLIDVPKVLDGPTSKVCQIVDPVVGPPVQICP